MIGGTMALMTCLAIFLLVQLTEIEDFRKKPTDRVAPLFGLVSSVKLKS